MRYFIVVFLLTLFSMTGCEKGFRSPFGFVDRPSNAAQAPEISSLFVSAITNNSAMIIWNTVKPADSKVIYGETASGGFAAGSPERVTSHAVTLSNLKSGARYYVTAVSEDPMGNKVHSPQESFITENLAGGATAPIGGSFPDSASRVIVSYTLTNPGSRSTEAIWIENNSGTFVRSLFVGAYANSNYNYLPSWESKSTGQTDGTTAATKSPDTGGSAGSHTVTWNCTNSAGSIVSAGTYRFRIAYRPDGGSESVCTGNITLGGLPAASSSATNAVVTSFSAAYTP